MSDIKIDINTSITPDAIAAAVKAMAGKMEMTMRAGSPRGGKITTMREEVGTQSFGEVVLVMGSRSSIHWMSLGNGHVLVLTGPEAGMVK